LRAKGIRGYSLAPMREIHGTRGFEAIADAIMYRWTIERDTWVGPSEVERARAYLAHAGIATRPLPDGRFVIEGSTATVCEASRLVLVGLQHLHATRRSTSAKR
jgi:hypothetical protein